MSPIRNKTAVFAFSVLAIAGVMTVLSVAPGSAERFLAAIIGFGVGAVFVAAIAKPRTGEPSIVTPTHDRVVDGGKPLRF